MIKINVNSIFQNRIVNLRNWSKFCVPEIRNVNHDSESDRYLSSKVWEITSAHIKESNTIGKFKIALKKWKV